MHLWRKRHEQLLRDWELVAPALDGVWRRTREMQQRAGCSKRAATDGLHFAESHLLIDFRYVRGDGGRLVPEYRLK